MDYLPKPETVKQLPKFEPRGHQGIFMGYYLQPGGQWKHEFMIFPLARFVDYDYARPRNLTELRPRRTQEAKLNGPLVFPLKEKYDIMKRTLPLTILRDASVYEHGGDDAGAAPGEPDADEPVTQDAFDSMLKLWKLFDRFGLGEVVHQATEWDQRSRKLSLAMA